MHNQQKKRMIQKLWGWVCLSINCLVVSLYLSEQHTELLNGGILLSVLTIGYGAIKTQMDKLKDDTSIASVAIEYVSLYIITFLLGFKTASYLSSFSVLIALVIVSLAEMLIFLFITYWLAIRRFLRGAKDRRRG